ncbi:MAG: preprotein translocase subunit SecG [Candidatus Omnitrophica bacterium]|nr:preprotein translocase subunit SecG [Candidatus Omnitrophota bacterium]
MLYTLVLLFHVFVVIGLISVILIQRGRSGGLIEALGGVESIFGTKTSSFFVKITVVLAVLFFVTTISLAYLSKQRGKSLMDRYKDVPVEQEKNASAPASSPAASPAPASAAPEKK